MPTVRVSGVSKRFGPVVAVEDVSFEVEPGEIFGLLGPNGAGKTTTIRMMLDIFLGRRTRSAASGTCPRSAVCTRTRLWIRCCPT